MQRIKELHVKVFLLEDIKLEETQSQICKLIDKTLALDNEFNEFHQKNIYKNYSFNMLYPLEKGKVYKKENLYTFYIRAVDEKISKYLLENLKNQYTDEIKVLTIQAKNIPIRHIESIYSITPIICKFKEGYWKSHSTIDTLEIRLRENLIKKFNSFYGVKIDEDFELFTSIEIKNRVPIFTNYKNIKLLGDKISFQVAENSTAQELANFALGVGLGEVNSRGFGFTGYKWI